MRTTAVTDAGLDHLSGMTTLRVFRRAHIKVTEAGVRELQAALPNCQIHLQPTSEATEGGSDDS